MIEDVLENYLDNVEEREFDAPFMALLRARGYWDIHFTHGTAEFGKDFIAKGNENEGSLGIRVEIAPRRRAHLSKLLKKLGQFLGMISRSQNEQVYQFAFQTKAGDVRAGNWRELRTQIDLLRTNNLSHPAFSLSLPRRAVIVITGRLTGNAPIEAQDYLRHLEKTGELLFEVWDKNTLVELMSRAPETGLFGHTQGEFFSLIGKIDTEEIRDYEIERYSRRWITTPLERNTLFRAAIETAILANRLRRYERLDLSCYVSLCLLRAAWASTHGVEPPNEVGAAISDIARNLFHYYANEIWERCDQDDLEPINFIRYYEAGPAAFVTYPLRCFKLIEILGLLGILDRNKADSIYRYLDSFLEKHPGAARLISDRWAVSLIPPILLLAKNGRMQTITLFLERVIRWVCDHYESGYFGLASPDSEPEEEIDYLFGSALEHIDLQRRNSSYVSTVVLDLSSVLEVKDLYETAVNDFLAVDVCPSVLEIEDVAGQYSLSDSGLSYSTNVEFPETWNPTDGWKIAPHHFRSSQSLYLQRIGRDWDLLALSFILRDRHFLSAFRNILSESTEAHQSN